MKYICIPIAVILIFMFGCRMEQETVFVPAGGVGGKFALLPGANLNGVVDLGTIQNTTVFPLLLSNTGNEPITHISIANSNPMFKMASVMSEVLRPRSDSLSTEIVSLVIIHGTNPSGIGLAATLNPGLNYDTLRIDGTTIDADNHVQNVHFETRLQVNALLADIRLFDGTREVDLTRPDYVVTGSGITTEEIFGYTITQPHATIVNSGNSTLDIIEYSGLTKVNERIIQPSDIDTVQRGSTVVIDTRGTVTIGARLHIASDGKCYIGL